MYLPIELCVYSYFIKYSVHLTLFLKYISVSSFDIVQVYVSVINNMHLFVFNLKTLIFVSF